MRMYKGATMHEIRCDDCHAVEINPAKFTFWATLALAPFGATVKSGTLLFTPDLCPGCADRIRQNWERHERRSSDGKASSA